MRTIIPDAIFAILFSVALFYACSKSEVLLREEKAIEPYYPRTRVDSTDSADSLPITFSVSVEGWNDLERIDL